MDHIIDENKEIVKFDKLNKLIDLYHYSPSMYKKDKNFSE